MLTGKSPFPDLPDQTVMIRVMKGERPKLPDLKGTSVPSSILKIIASSWNQDPTKRPHINAITNELWVICREMIDEIIGDEMLPFLLKQLEVRRILPKVMNDRICKMALQPGLKLVASAFLDGTINIWNAETGDSWRPEVAHSRSISCLSFSPDGKLLLSAGEDRVLRIWDTESHSISGIEWDSAISSIACAPDGNSVALGHFDRSVRIWELGSQTHRTFEGHNQAVSSLAFAPGGLFLVSATRDQEIRIWNIQTGAKRPAHVIAVSAFGMHAQTRTAQFRTMLYLPTEMASLPSHFRLTDDILPLEIWHRLFGSSTLRAVL